MPVVGATQFWHPLRRLGEHAEDLVIRERVIDTIDGAGRRGAPGCNGVDRRKVRKRLRDKPDRWTEGFLDRSDQLSFLLGVRVHGCPVLDDRLVGPVRASGRGAHRRVLGRVCAVRNRVVSRLNPRAIGVFYRGFGNATFRDPNTVSSALQLGTTTVSGLSSGVCSRYVDLGSDILRSSIGDGSLQGTCCGGLSCFWSIPRPGRFIGRSLGLGLRAWLDRFGYVDLDLFLSCLGNPLRPGLDGARGNCVVQVSFIMGGDRERLGNLALVDAWLCASMEWFIRGFGRFRCVVGSGCIPVGTSVSPLVNRGVLLVGSTLFSLAEMKRLRGWNAYLELCTRETLLFDVQQRICAEVGEGSRSDREAKSGKGKTRTSWGTMDLYSSVGWSTGHEATNGPDWAIEVLIMAFETKDGTVQNDPTVSLAIGHPLCLSDPRSRLMNVEPQRPAVFDIRSYIIYHTLPVHRGVRPRGGNLPAGGWPGWCARSGGLGAANV